jgi:hypothetical protein
LAADERIFDRATPAGMGLRCYACRNASTHRDTTNIMVGNTLGICGVATFAPPYHKRCRSARRGNLTLHPQGPWRAIPHGTLALPHETSRCIEQFVWGHRSPTPHEKAPPRPWYQMAHRPTEPNAHRHRQGSRTNTCGGRVSLREEENPDRTWTVSPETKADCAEIRKMSRKVGGVDGTRTLFR